MTEAQSPVPQSPELRAEFARWEWLPQAWSDLSAESRRSYDDWVSQGRTSRVAARRARAVARRCYHERPWAGRSRRAVQAVQDFLSPTDLPPGSSGIDGTMAG